MQFRADFYASNESLESPYAVSDDQSLWQIGAPFATIDEAKDVCRTWANTKDSYKTTRVVELDDNGSPTSVLWMSVWEAPLTFNVGNEAKGSAGIAGMSVKLHVWMDRELGAPDHWDWQGMFTRALKKTHCLDDPNSWDLEYGRKVDSNGRNNLWSIRLNLWPIGASTTPDQWTWWKILGKDEEHAHEVEMVRAHDIEPRSFPEGAELATCAGCGKVHLASASWTGYNPDSGDMEPYDRCFCIDQRFGVEDYRETPDGEAVDLCVWEEEKAKV